MPSDRSFQPSLFDNPPDEFRLLPLDQYDVIAVGYSGGTETA
jgi:hypothetical protein